MWNIGKDRTGLYFSDSIRPVNAPILPSNAEREGQFRALEPGGFRDLLPFPQIK